MQDFNPAMIEIMIIILKIYNTNQFLNIVFQYLKIFFFVTKLKKLNLITRKFIENS